jgi:hypothetical protein
MKTDETPKQRGSPHRFGQPWNELSPVHVVFSSMLVPRCIYHSIGLVAMREGSPRTRTTGFERQESLMRIWECEVPGCGGLYDHAFGYHRAETEEKPHSLLTSVWAKETVCREHALPMLAAAEEYEVITFRCPNPVCDNHVFVPRTALGCEP